MSLLCGIYRLRPDAALPEAWRSHLRANLKRGTVGTVSEFGDARLFLLKLDIGAFDAPGWSDDPQRITALAGDAIFTDSGVPRGRADDMAALTGTNFPALLDLLVTSRGYFNFARYDRATGQLALAVDRVGLRTMYVYRDADVLVFSGALRLIETLPGIRLTTDLQGVLEAAAFGATLGTRTRYTQVSCMAGGTLCQFTDGIADSRQYWKFDRDACTRVETDLESALDRLYAQFQRAVALRAGRRRAVFSALSGGLDSRSVTTELWRRGLEVHSLNVSWQGSQDDVLARQYAGKLGVTHHFMPRPLEEAGNSLAQRLHALITDVAHLCPDLPSTPRQMWSGNGGSVGLGFALLSPKATALLNAGDTAAASRQFIGEFKYGLSGKLLRSQLAGWAERLPFDSLMESLATIRCAEPARALYVFHIENGQRRALAFHLEQIDLVCFEFIEPLFDPEVLRIVCGLPMGFCHDHHMYHEWLKRFPPEVFSVAWQAYPGHEPCPVPLPPGAFDQWETPQRHGRLLLFRDATRGALGYLKRRRRFREVLRTGRVLTAYTLQGLQLRNTSHLLRQVEYLDVPLGYSAARSHWPGQGD